MPFGERVVEAGRKAGADPERPKPMRIGIPDDLAERLQALLPDKPLEEIVNFQLQRFATIPPRERVIVVRQPDRQALERILDNGSITSAEELLAAVEKRGKITLGGVALEYTQAQLREIERRARKNKRSAEDELQSIAKETAKLMLDEA